MTLISTIFSGMNLGSANAISSLAMGSKNAHHQAMQITGSLTAELFVQAQQLHVRPHGLRKALLCLLGIFWLIYVIVYLTTVNHYETIFMQTIPLLVVPYLTLLVFIIWPNRWRKRFNEMPLLQSQQTITLDESGLYNVSEHAETHITWDEVKKWRQSKHLILVYDSNSMFILPLSWFSDAAAIRETEHMLKAKLGPRR